jgi:hypothetical protein
VSRLLFLLPSVPERRTRAPNCATWRLPGIEQHTVDAIAFGG